MKKIWTNGCFDIIHVGHIELFQYAKMIGDKLIVGIDSDHRVKKLKGEDRPVNCQFDRKKVLESIRWIDEVFIFDTPEEMCNIVNLQSIDTIVIGDDYIGKRVTASDKVNNVIYFPKLKHYSTSSILKKYERKSK